MLPGWKLDDILPQLTRRAVAHVEERAKAKQPFFLFMTLTSPHEPIAPSAVFRGKSGLNALADFILETDATVGAMMRAVQQADIAENTLFIFTADNGSSLYTGGAELEKIGHRVSAGFRGAKTNIYEGGHRVPFFARWPGRIKNGAVCEDVICLTDFMATAAQIVGAKLPDNAGEDSVSMLPDLLGAAKGAVREATVHQSGAGEIAIRQGQWKLIFSKSGPRQLYDLKNDVGENTNVFSAQGEVAAKLTKLMQRYVATGRSTAGVAQPNTAPANLLDPAPAGGAGAKKGKRQAKKG